MMLSIGQNSELRKIFFVLKRVRSLEVACIKLISLLKLPSLQFELNITISHRNCKIMKLLIRATEDRFFINHTMKIFEDFKESKLIPLALNVLCGIGLNL